MTTQDIRVENITVREATKEQSPNGELQWKVKADVPSIRSKFPTQFFVPVRDAGEIIGNSSYRIKIAKGKLKPGKPGQYDTDFYWNVLEWNTEASEFQQPYMRENTPAPRSESPRESREQYWDDRQRQISWAQAVNLAVELFCSHGGGNPTLDSEDMVIIKANADTMFALITEGPPSQNESAVPQQAMHGGAKETMNAAHEEAHDAFIRKFWPMVKDHFTSKEIDRLLGINLRAYLDAYPDTTPEGLTSHVEALAAADALGAPEEESEEESEAPF